MKTCARSMVLLAALLITPAFATTFYVDASRPDDAGDGLSWATAKKTMQAAVDLAVSNDVVTVTNGVYAAGARVTPGYACPNRVVMTNAIIVQSVNGPAVTIIQGHGVPGASAVRCAYMSAGTLVGFTLTNGGTRTNGDKYYDRSGGGVNMYAGDGMVSNCLIVGNAAQDSGGGTYYGTVNHCTISQNTAQEGGGTRYGTINYCTIIENAATYGGGTRGGTVNHCLISGNWAYWYGGGTYAGTVNHSMISDNWVYYYGGGACSATINHSTISGNVVAHYGGGTYAGTVNNSTICANSAYAGGGTYESTVNNSTISGNTAESSGGGTQTGSVRNAIVWNNSAPQGCNYMDAELSYSCTTPAAPGMGNITNDPVLLGAAHISVSSPCLGAGSSSYATGADIDGEAWRTPPAMGCDEVYPNGLTGALRVAISTPSTTTVVGAALTFSGLMDGRPLSNHWSFGDGSTTANSIQPHHAWNAPGQYEVVLTACNVDYPAGVAATAGVTVVALDLATFYVDVANGAPSYPYQSWATAATTIQEAVDAAEISDINGAGVIVTDGVYALGARVTPGYACSNRVVITKNIIVQSVNGPAATHIQGQGPLGSNAVRCVYMAAGIMAGFSLTNGGTMSSGDWIYDCAGGGVHMRGGNSMVSNCLMSGNAASSFGGGASGGMVSHCTIRGNSVNDDGGGAALGIISHSTISANAAGQNGGGCLGGTVNNCVISENVAKRGGGTVFSAVNHCTLSENAAVWDGGGVYDSTVYSSTISGNSTLYGTGGGTCESTVNNCAISENVANRGGGTAYSAVNNCTISGNIANQSGGGTYYGSVGNAIVWNNSATQGFNYFNATLEYSCTTPAAPGIGNITNDPVMLSAAHIYSASPCLGAGTHSYATGCDIDDEAWRNPPAIGCDEVYPDALTGVLNVAISAPRTTNLVGGVLAFAALIAGRPASNYWLFGDGSAVANNICAHHAWNATGQYAVILMAFNADYPAGVAATVGVSIVMLDQATFYVNLLNAAPNYPYQTWTTAATSIQDAVDAAEMSGIPGARVLVTNGVYATGARSTPGYSCSNRLVVTKNIIVQSVNGPTPTIIQGQGPKGNSAVRCVYMSAGTLVGFTLTNGSTRSIGDLNYDLSGGGVNMYAGSGMVSNCLIVGNSAYVSGGGTYYGTVNNGTISGNAAQYGGGTYGGTVDQCAIRANSAVWNGGGTYGGTLKNSTVTGNSAMWGGGMCVSTGSNCTISGNTASNYGGGTSGGMVSNCTLSGNMADYGGGTSGGTVNQCAISGNAAIGGGGAYAGTVINCAISGNAADYGGGTFDCTVHNCTISGNSANYNGGGVTFGTLTNSIAWANTAPASSNMSSASAAYTCSDPLPAGDGNICVDPQFVNTNAGNYRLQEGSSCINAGTNLPWMAGATDLDGNPRIYAERVDMGAYEFAPEPALIRHVVLIALGALGRKLGQRQAGAQ